MSFSARKDRDAITLGTGRQRTRLERDKEAVCVRFDDSLKSSQRGDVVQHDPQLGDFEQRIEIPNEPRTVVPVAGRDDGKSRSFKVATRELMNRDDVVSVVPVYRQETAQLIPTDRLFVSFRPGFRAIKTLLRKHGCHIPPSLKTRQIGSMYVVELIHPNDDPITIAERLAAEEDVEFAEPDFVTMVPRDGALSQPIQSPTATEAAANEQTDFLAITETREAWLQQTATSEVCVAVLDVGIDRRHPDLHLPLQNMANTVDDGGDGAPLSHDFHGTACAGILAGRGKEPEGIAGVGKGCRLVSIRIGQTTGGTNSQAVIRAMDVVEGLRLAWDSFGADVISLSWFTAELQSIRTSLDLALNQGRGGMGSVVVAASGNGDLNRVDFPARHTGVIAVGATDAEDVVKRANTGAQWGSNWGPELALVAPGVNLRTTDNVDHNGQQHGQAPGLYATFSGTSAATPVVAGAAAIILCCQPSLNRQEVFNLLTSTCDKPVGMNQQECTDEYGFGRLNVLKAVQVANPDRLKWTGQIRQVGSANPGIRAGGYFIEREDGASVTLRISLPGDTFPALEQDEANFEFWSMFDGQTVTVRGTELTEFPSGGAVLWGVTIES